MLGKLNATRMCRKLAGLGPKGKPKAEPILQPSQPPSNAGPPPDDAALRKVGVLISIVHAQTHAYMHANSRKNIDNYSPSTAQGPWQPMQRCDRWLPEISAATCACKVGPYRQRLLPSNMDTEATPASCMHHMHAPHSTGTCHPACQFDIVCNSKAGSCDAACIARRTSCWGSSVRYIYAAHILIYLTCAGPAGRAAWEACLGVCRLSCCSTRASVLSQILG